MKKTLPFLCFGLLLVAVATAETTPQAPDTSPPTPRIRAYIGPINSKIQPAVFLPYKTVGDTTLNLHLFNPANIKSGDKRPCLMAIHGGGWSAGEPLNVYAYGQWAADHGMVGVSVQYRLYRSKAPRILVADCVRDIRSAVRYLKQNATKLGIDPDKIVTLGVSAGGHLALAPAMFKFDDPADDLSIKTDIAAAVLFSPVIDTSKEGYGHFKVGSDWQSLSPRHNVTPGLPPVLLLHGSADTTTPYLGAEIFAQEMKKVGNFITFITRQDGIHTYMCKFEKDYTDSLEQLEAFLKSRNLRADPAP